MSSQSLEAPTEDAVDAFDETDARREDESTLDLEAQETLWSPRWCMIGPAIL